MTLRGWVPILGMTVCLSPGTGCTHTLAPSTHANPGQSVAAVPEKPAVEQVASPGGSPYHPLPPMPEAKASQPNGLQVDSKANQARDGQIERAHYPSSNSVADLIPAPTPPPPTPSPPAAPGPTPVSIKPAAAEAKPIADPPLVAALRYYMNKQPAEAVNCLRPYGKPAQELLLYLLPLVVRLTEQHEWRDTHEVDAIMGQLVQALDSLRPIAPLKIEKMCLVSSIQRFGVYQSLPDDQPLRSGDFVQVYAEFQNYSTQRDGNLHVIRLRSRMEICDFNGKKCWQYDFRDANKPDVSATPRHDFFYNYELYVPPIPPGQYTLRLQVTDVPTQRTVTRTLDFRVAPGRSARERMRDEG